MSTSLSHVKQPESGHHPAQARTPADGAEEDEAFGCPGALPRNPSPAIRTYAPSGIVFRSAALRTLAFFISALRYVIRCCPIVEYERSKPNPWGPYPVKFKRLRELFSQVGMERVEKVKGAPLLIWGNDVFRFCRTVQSANSKSLYPMRSP